MTRPDFQPFGKVPRFSRDIVITEKIDGTNAVVHVTEDGDIYFGSRTRWITPEDDNYGFARWGTEHAEELKLLGPGFHYGEWWGAGIQRRYGLAEKRFSLFNVARWGVDRPACCHVVPTLYAGPMSEHAITTALIGLEVVGSEAAPAFMWPEGIMIYHTASGQLFKKTIEDDAKGKGE